MSQLFRDVPELEAVPHVLKSGLWMRAFHLALFAPQTWILALAWTAIATSLGAILGYRLLGTLGAFLLAATAMCAAPYFFIRFFLERLARMRLPQAQSEADWTPEQQRLILASNKIIAVITEQRRRDGIDD